MFRKKNQKVAKNQKLGENQDFAKERQTIGTKSG